jgi:ABC-type bacteriocin/lantibiotic exporter with double-glycine peptidase domain
MVHITQLSSSFINNRSAGPMARRLTTNQEIAGSIPASINTTLPWKSSFCSLLVLWMMSDGSLLLLLL